MKLIRLCTITLSKIPSNWKNFALQYGPVTVECHSYTAFILVKASLGLQFLPKRTKDRFVVLNDKHIKTLEHSIEYTANVLSIAEGLERKISSPKPSVALEPESEKDAQFLEQCKGFFFKANAKVFASTNVSIDLEKCAKDLVDRMDGAALLAEANSHKHCTGKFHEFIRVFERAFTKSSKLLIGPMANFLNPDLGYSTEEVESWIKIRHSVTHADLKQEFLLESDVNRIIKRVEQAAYDVLFNKKNWRSTDTERRDAFRITFGTSDSNNSLLITQGSEGAIAFQLMDEFGAYPFNLNAVINPLPKGWWSPYSNEESVKFPLGNIVKPKDSFDFDNNA